MATIDLDIRPAKAAADELVKYLVPIFDLLESRADLTLEKFERLKSLIAEVRRDAIAYDASPPPHVEPDPAPSVELTRTEQRVADLMWRFGSIDGAHHKQWLLDQVLRELLGPDRYAGQISDWDEERRMGDDPEDWDSSWDEGIAP